MDKNETVEVTLRVILLILFSVKLTFAILAHIDLIYSMYSVDAIMRSPMLILKLNLFTEPLIILLGMVGVFVKRKIGFVFMLLLPSLLISYELMPYITKSFSIESVWLHILLPIIFYLLINSKKVRLAYKCKTIKQSIFLNFCALTIGLFISSVMYYFNGRLIIN